MTLDDQIRKRLNENQEEPISVPDQNSDTSVAASQDSQGWAEEGLNSVGPRHYNQPSYFKLIPKVQNGKTGAEVITYNPYTGKPDKTNWQAGDLTDIQKNLQHSVSNAMFLEDEEELLMGPTDDPHTRQLIRHRVGREGEKIAQAFFGGELTTHKEPFDLINWSARKAYEIKTINSRSKDQSMRIKPASMHRKVEFLQKHHLTATQVAVVIYDDVEDNEIYVAPLAVSRRAKNMELIKKRTRKVDPHEDFDFTSTERDFWDKKKLEGDQDKIAFIVQNQEKVPARVVNFSADQLQDMSSEELESVYSDVQKGLGLEQPEVGVFTEEELERPAMINFILKKEKDVLNQKFWFKHLANFHDIPDSEVKRLYDRIQQVLTLTDRNQDASLNEAAIDEQHVIDRNSKINYILQNQKWIYPDMHDWFNDEDLALFSDKYINKLYDQTETVVLGKHSFAEEVAVDWNEIRTAMNNKDYAKVAYIFDTTTGLGADDVVETLLAKGYSSLDIEHVVHEIFGDEQIPAYFKDKLSPAYLQNSEILTQSPIEEDGGTTAGMAAPSLPAFGKEPKVVDSWAGLDEAALGDVAKLINTAVHKLDHSSDLTQATTIKSVLNSYTPQYLKQLTPDEATEVYHELDGYLKSVGIVDNNVTEGTGEPMGATMGQLNLTPDPVELEKDQEMVFEDINKLDSGKLRTLYTHFAEQVVNKHFGDDYTEEPLNDLKKYLTPFVPQNLIENTINKASKQFKDEDGWEYESFKNYMFKQLLEKSGNKDKVLAENSIFKNNTNEQTGLIQNTMANQDRFAVSENDIATLEKAASQLSFKVIGVRGDLKESGREDKLEIVVEKQNTRALVEYFDNDAKPFVVEGKKFTTIHTALGFISENADRFTSEQTEETFNSEGKKRAIAESEALADYTKKAYESYDIERAKFAGRELEIMKSIMTEEQLKRGIAFRKK